MKQFKNQLSILSTLFLGVLIFGYSCTSSENGAKEEPVVEEVILEEEPVVEEVVVEEDVWVIDEHHINAVPVTSHGKKINEKKNAEVAANLRAEANEIAEEAEVEEMEEEEIVEAIEYEILTAEEMELALAEEEYEAMNTVEVTEMAIPLEETQTVTSYGKKGQPEAEFQVVTNSSTGEVEHIVFTDKKHRDVYDVQAGMTGKEVKKLRKELKHMEKNGQHFLYDDQSNVMYLMTATDEMGDEVTDADIETMEVQAVVWKDKKHHQKRNKKA
jgi:hypothetical protein